MKNALLRKIILMSRLMLYGIFVQAFFISLLNAGDIAAQESIYEIKLDVYQQDKTVSQFFKYVERKTDFKFTYNSDQVDLNSKVSISATDKSLGDILEEVSQKAKVNFRRIDYNIHVSKKEDTSDQVEEVISVFAADVPISGKVFDENGDPLPGATIVVKGTAVGTISDINGGFSLLAPNDATSLIVSFVGYQSQEVSIAGRSTIDITLQADIQALQEIVVIGYGAVKKADITGSVAQVKSEELQAVPVFNVEQALKARAAGVQVTQNSGEPGGRIEVRIRGGNSMIGSNQPLYVVDGFPMTGGINFLNPADIESIDILKDASATAIYGARGANGVVIITSKRGSADQKGKIEVNSSYGVQTTTKRYDLMNAREYAVVANEWLKNGGQQPYFDVNAVQNPGTDWQDAVLQAAPIQNHTVALSGGGDRTRYSLSGNYFDQEGIMINTGAKRGSVRLNLDHEVNDWLKAGVNLNISRRQQLTVPNNNGYRGTTVLSAAASAPPTLSVYDENGLPTQIEKAYSFGSADMRNPMIFAQNQTDNISNNVVGNSNFEVKLTDDLSFKTLLGIEYAYTLVDYYSPIIFPNDRGYASQNTYYRSSFLNENTLRYNKTFSDIHNLSVVAGYTYQTDMNRSFGVSVNGFSNNTTRNYNLGAAETIGTPGSGISEWTLASWLARANYSFDDRYLLTVSMRTDGSSRFGTNNKWAVFPSAAIGWRISEEAFMSNVSAVSDLKLRASYGITGNTALSPYQSLDRMSSVRAIYADQKFAVGYSPSGISNPDLRWETTAQLDVGVDFGMLDNRLRFTLDYYKKNTTDLLASVPLPPSVGFGSILQNVGEIQNQGFEFTVNADILTRDLTWDVTGSFSLNRNKVIDLAGGSDILSAGQGAVWSSTNIARVGQPLGMFYGYLEDGLTDQGFIKYKDLNEDGVINSLDRTILGNPNPDFFYGINSHFTYKGFDLNVFFEGVYGNQIFNATNGTHLNSFQRGSNQFRDLIGNYWTTENPDPNAKYPKISAATGVDVSDRFIEMGSYLRLKSVKLAYNLPVKNWGMNWADQAQVYVSGINLLTFTKYTGLDPEVNTKGVDNQNVSNRLEMGHDQSSYPNAKLTSIGLQINF
ncbi:TonB-dependent receptor [Imperialibacter roseus]|uniref:TonB-dependent receptor n=1 Tax=Imperialibacter roseus TaxID=1324217 RepID=A0ABZ0IYS0_9BACT|nr:TonB-dependent receptor [Imperialibacter roseus]WOK09657.1 TonB-dependent receptor [Imperialibacter roseus]